MIAAQIAAVYRSIIPLNDGRLQVGIRGGDNGKTPTGQVRAN
jgi:hypothetical protein